MIFNILLTYPKSENLNLFLKEAVSWDFVIFFSWIKPIWVPDKQSKIISSKNSFSKIFMKNVTPRSVTLCGVGKLKCPKIQMVSHCAESDSVKHHTARSPTPSSMYKSFFDFQIFFLEISSQRPLKSWKLKFFLINWNCLTPPSVILCEVQLCAVSHCAESDSAQCETILDFWTFQFPDSAQCDTALSLVF